MTGVASQSVELEPRLREVAAAVESRKALDLKILDLREISDFTEYFVICSGTNPRQVRAIGDAVVERLKGQGVRPLGVEGHARGSWILVDYGSILVHVFDEETRAYYRIERLWADGADVTDQISS